MLPENVVPLSLIVAAFAWHTPVLSTGEVASNPLDTQTLAVVYDRKITLRYDWPNWPKQLTCTIIVRAVGALERGQNVKYGAHEWPVRPSCRYVFGGTRRARAPHFFPPNLLPQ